MTVDIQTILQSSLPQGESGFSGISGWSGDSGISGFSGYSGLDGLDGASGFSGYSGLNGFTGESGFSGYSGIDGLSGASGISGYSGQDGIIGLDGASGFSGYSGSGISGFSGFSGVSPQSVFYDANSISTVVGTYVSGGVTDIQNFGDDNYYIVSEVSGSPGWNIAVTFTGVVNFNQVQLALKYTHTSHVIYFEIYNNNTASWDIVGVFSGTNLVFASHIFDVIDDTAYISSGTVLTRIYHETSGVANVNVEIDFVTIGLTTQGPQGISGLSGFSGISGFSGFSGVVGASGTSGFSGAVGAAGTSGFSGINGSAGTSGFSGFSGSNGSAGASGTSGFSGFSGRSGFSGGTGPTVYPGAGVAVSTGSSWNTSLTATNANTGSALVQRDASGNFSAGTITATLSGSATSAATFTSTSQNSQFNSIGVGTTASGTAGSIRATNDITAYYSDDRLKTKLGKIENALEMICNLEGFYYHANETAQALGYEVKREVGLSAQSTQKEMPEIVAPAPIDDKYLTIRYERYAPYFVEAIKELKKEINELKSKIN